MRHGTVSGSPALAQKWDEYPNLSRRPPSPSKGRGPVQRGVRRALIVRGIASTSEIMPWCYRTRGRDRRERENRSRAIRLAADKIAVRVGRAPTIGRPWLWRLRNGAE
jgi:hypothetical protein